MASCMPKVSRARASMFALAAWTLLMLGGCGDASVPTPARQTSPDAAQQTAVPGPTQDGATAPGEGVDPATDESQLMAAAHEWVTGNALGPYKDISGEIVALDAQFARVRMRAAMRDRQAEGGDYEDYKVALVFEKPEAGGTWQLANSPTWTDPAEQATVAKRRAKDVDLLEVEFSEAEAEVNEGWAIGTYRESASTGGILFHIEGEEWQPVLSEESRRMYTDLFVVSSEEAWVVTQRDLSSSHDTKSELLHMVHGDWETVRLPSVELWGAGIYMVDKGSRGWLVSSYDTLSYTRGQEVGEGAGAGAGEGATDAAQGSNPGTNSGSDLISDPGRWQIVDRFSEGAPNSGFVPGRVVLASSSEGWSVHGSRLLRLKAGVWSESSLDSDPAEGESGSGEGEGGGEGDRLKTLYDVDLTPSGDAYVVGLAESKGIASDYGVVLRYDANAEAWTRIDVPETGAIRAIDIVNEGEGDGDGEAWAVGDDLFHLKDRVWTLVRNPTHHPLSDVVIFQDGSGFAVGERGTVLRMEAGATEWKAFDAFP